MSDEENKIERMYSRQEAMELCSLSRDAIVHLIRDGQLRAVKIRGRWRIPASELLKLQIEGS